MTVKVQPINLHIEQVSPSLKSSRQVHSKSVVPMLTHVPPFLHGDDAHGKAKILSNHSKMLIFLLRMTLTFS